MLQTTDEEHTEAQKSSRSRLRAKQLDVSLVIDTTGSMGDEIRYLQSEFLALSSAIEEKYPNAEQRWSLVVVQATWATTTSRAVRLRDNAMEFRDKLAEQARAAAATSRKPRMPRSAAMAELSWRTEDKVARLAFWSRMLRTTTTRPKPCSTPSAARARSGVHLYPVASSGVDELTEVSYALCGAAHRWSLLVLD